MTVDKDDVESAHLVVQLDERVLQTIHLDKPIITIGRTPDSDLVLLGSQVSGQHAEVRISQEGTILTDLGSPAGTSMAGVRLLPQRPRLLVDGEAFQIGPYKIYYRSGSAPQTEITLQPAQVTLPSSPPSAAVVSPPDVTLVPIKPPLRTWKVSVHRRSDVSIYLEYLPELFHDNDFLRRFLMIFETLWEPMEQRQDSIAMYFDPRTCPASLLEWFAGWLDLEVTPLWPEGRLRSLLAEAMELHRWRGTKYGLTRVLEICTGLTPQIEEGSQPLVFHIKFSFPKDAKINQESIEKLIEMQKPAHAGYVLEVQR